MREKPPLTIEAIAETFSANTTLKGRALLMDTYDKTAEVSGIIKDVLQGKNTMPGIVAVLVADESHPDFNITCDFSVEENRELKKKLLDLKKQDRIAITGELGFFAPGALSIRSCKII
jgi:hypothetical protein